ncbi:MAG: PLP-dependent transferase [Planctomycetia bacterium]|nr:PLP-dependent transferase [Planctomycetia bacterium]
MAGSGSLDPVDVIIGNMALQQKLVDDGQLAEARMMCSMKSDRSLAQVLYGLGYLSIQQAEKLEHAATVLRTREEDKLLCELAVKRKIITQAQADEVLLVQKNATRNPGPIPRVKELLLNREYVKGPLVDILMSLVQQVSPFSRQEKEAAPPKEPPGGGKAVDSKVDTGRAGKPSEDGPIDRKGDTVRLARPASSPGPQEAVRPSGTMDAVPAAGPSTPKPAAPAGSGEKGTGFLTAQDRLQQMRRTPGSGISGAPASKPATAPPAPGRPFVPPPKTEKPAAPATAPALQPRPEPVPAPTGGGERISLGQIHTLAVHVGRTPPADPTIDPIMPSVTYDFPSMEALEEFLKGKEGFWYSRHGNPTVRAAEEKIAALEGAEDAVLAGSGMAALTATLLTLLRPGDSIATIEGLYGGTWHLFNDVLSEFNIQIRKIPAKDWLLIREHLSGTTKLIYFEPVTNPMLRIWDPRPPAKDAKRFGILTMVDNTFATCVNLRPIEHGVDLVFHSATKYLGGHSDVTAGVVCGKKDHVQRIRERLKLLGPTLSAFDAWLLMRGLKTFPLRMRAHNENALFVAQGLESLSGVRKVWYPGLESHPDRALAKELLKGGGGVVTFEVEGGLDGAKAFCNRLQLCHRAVSLGGVETLVSIPVLSSHWQIPERELEKAGISPGCVRISVGIEDPQDILDDVRQAMS